MSWEREYGLQRRKFRRRIQEFLDKAGLNQTSFAERYGLTRQAVSATLLGLNNSETILNGLRELGVDESFLCDPRKQKTQKKWP